MFLIRHKQHFKLAIMVLVNFKAEIAMVALVDLDRAEAVQINFKEAQIQDLLRVAQMEGGSLEIVVGNLEIVRVDSDNRDRTMVLVNLVRIRTVRRDRIMAVLDSLVVIMAVFKEAITTTRG